MREHFQSVSIDKLLKYGTAAILLVIPLYPKFPVFAVPGTYVAIRMEDFLLFALLIVLLIWFKKQGLKEILREKIVWAIALFLIAGLLSVLSGVFLTQTSSLHIAFLHWFRRIEYFIPFFVAYAAANSPRRGKFYLEVIFIACVLAFIYGFGQINFDFPVISTQNEEYSKGAALRWIPGARLHSTFGGHYDLAAYLVMVIPLALVFLMNIGDKFKRLLFLLLFIFPVYWLFLQTEARVSFIAYLVGVSFCFLLMRKVKYIPVLIALSLIGMIFWSNLGARYGRTVIIYKDKLIQKLQAGIVVKPAYAQSDAVEPGPSAVLEDRSFSIRFKVEWPRAVRSFTKNPLLGTGYSSISLATDNDYLRLLGEVGIVGALAFILIILRLLQKMGMYLHTFKEGGIINIWVVGFFGALIGILLNAFFIDVFEASKVAIIFWTLAGITVGLINSREEVYGKKILN